MFCLIVHYQDSIEMRSQRTNEFKKKWSQCYTTCAFPTKKQTFFGPYAENCANSTCLKFLGKLPKKH